MAERMLAKIAAVRSAVKYRLRGGRTFAKGLPECDFKMGAIAMAK